MDLLIQDKETTRDVIDVQQAGAVRMLFHDVSDRLELTREVYNPENSQYEVFEYVHETFSKDKMVINGRDTPVDFFGTCSKFRVIR